jgi:hypothetical protein
LITVLGKEAATQAAESIAMFYFRDCMLDNLEPVLDQLSLMTALLKLEDPEVQEYLDRLVIIDAPPRLNMTTHSKP